MTPLRATENEIDSRSRPRRFRSGFEFLLRYLSIIGLCFWMGGFTFYAGVVIHAGHRFWRASGDRLSHSRSDPLAEPQRRDRPADPSRKPSLRLAQDIRLATLLLMAGIQVALFVL